MRQRIVTPADTEQGIDWVSPTEARARFDQQVYELLHIRAADFVRKLDAGEYDAQLDDLAHPEIMHLVSINPYRR